MADGRMLKKAISTSRRLADLKSDSARMLYTWIIPHLDIEGRFYADPLMIKGAVVPRIKSFSIDLIEKCLSDMHEVGLIRIYMADGDRYLQLRKFEDHQNLRRDKEAASQIPAPSDEDNSDTTPGVLPEQSGPTPAEVKRSKDKIREDTRTRDGRKTKTPLPENFHVSDNVRKWAVKNRVTRLDEHLESFKAKCLANGYTYVNWDAAFQEAIRSDWARLNQQGGGNGRTYTSGRDGRRPTLLDESLSEADEITRRRRAREASGSYPGGDAGADDVPDFQVPPASP